MLESAVSTADVIWRRKILRNYMKISGGGVVAYFKARRHSFRQTKGTHTERKHRKGCRVSSWIIFVHDAAVLAWTV
jgi:hypothetical protein